MHWGKVMGKRKNIVLFIAMIENEISKAVCEGALLAAKEMDANLYILPVGMIDAAYDDVEANCYRYQYSTLLSFAHFPNVDAIVMEYGSITSCMEVGKKKEMLAQMKNVPIILLAEEEEGYSSICIDNRTGIEHAVNHLVKEKNCRKIGFVSGPVETNQDARERLETYRNTMLSNGISIEEDWIAYGNFSEFTEEIVAELLTKHPDMEALVFANDKMAIGGYYAMSRLGIKPGKDILVTGFDDSPDARILEPQLTSVKLDAGELAYRAVLACDDVMAGKEVHQLVDSHLVVRESSGMKGNTFRQTTQNPVPDVIDESYISKVKKEIYDTYFVGYYTTKETLHAKALFEQYVDYYMHLVDANGVLHLDEEEFVRKYNELSVICHNGYVDMNQFVSIGYLLHTHLNHMVKEEEARLRLLQAVTSANQSFMNEMTKIRVAEENSMEFEIVLTSVTRDMLQFSKEERKKYWTVIAKLQRLQFASGYILTYGDVIEHQKEDEWQVPKHLYIRAYHNGDDVHLYTGKERKIRLDSIFSNKMLPQDRRFDMLVMPIFSGENQYGIFLVETQLKNVNYASQIVSQVSVSVELLDIIKKQNAIKKELEKNLALTVENNRILDEMSRSDPLTGILNRRGYMDHARQIMENEANFGKKVIAVYADMDNLKIINDEFGHDEGDYSLKIIAQTLTESFRQTDVVARMGGDEFAAFAIVNQEDFPQVIRERIRTVLEELNQNDKPYLVDMSVGTAEFIIDENSDLERILSEADDSLYLEKRHKKKVVYKPHA